jgi:hypothetical protein
MDPNSFSFLFAAFLLVTLGVKLWLSSRHIRYVANHRDAVPAQFAQKIPLTAHQKAADYTIAKTQLKLVLLVVNALVLLGFTLLGGLQWLSTTLGELAGPSMVYQIALIAGVVLLRPDQANAGGRCNRSAADLGHADRDGESRCLLVAVRVADLVRVSDTHAWLLPEPYRAAVQQVHTT